MNKEIQYIIEDYFENQLNEAENTGNIIHDLQLFKSYNGCSNKNCCCKSDNNLAGVAYDFHHKDNSAKRKKEADPNKENKDIEQYIYKETLISQKAKNGASYKILEELLKCTVLCANCHRMYHFNPDYVTYDNNVNTLYNFIIYCLIENKITYYKNTIISWLRKLKQNNKLSILKFTKDQYEEINKLIQNYKEGN